MSFTATPSPYSGAYGLDGYGDAFDAAPADRTLTVRAEDRSVTVAAEDRTVEVPA